MIPDGILQKISNGSFHKIPNGNLKEIPDEMEISGDFSKRLPGKNLRNLRKKIFSKESRKYYERNLKKDSINSVRIPE